MITVSANLKVRTFQLLKVCTVVKLKLKNVSVASSLITFGFMPFKTATKVFRHGHWEMCLLYTVFK